MGHYSITTSPLLYWGPMCHYSMTNSPLLYWGPMCHYSITYCPLLYCGPLCHYSITVSSYTGAPCLTIQLLSPPILGPLVSLFNYCLLLYWGPLCHYSMTVSSYTGPLVSLFNDCLLICWGLIYSLVIRHGKQWQTTTTNTPFGGIIISKYLWQSLWLLFEGKILRNWTGS